MISIKKEIMSHSSFPLKNKKTFCGNKQELQNHLPSHSNSLLFSEGVSKSSKSMSPLSSKSDKTDSSLRSKFKLISGAVSFFLTLVPLTAAFKKENLFSKLK